MNYSWCNFVERWIYRSDVTFVRYEDIRQNSVFELRRIVRELAQVQLSEAKATEIVEALSFSKQSGRLPGQEDKKSFLRKGIIGDWQNQFTQEARAVFNHYGGQTLIQLGYEKDHSWASAE